MRGWPQRILVGLAGTVILALLACPSPPNPGPNGPGGAGGSAPPAIVSCDTGCKHAEKVCPGSGSPCGPACNRTGSVYAACVGAAANCAALKACDPLNGPQGAPQPLGR
jgi:hypothetical protein